VNGDGERTVNKMKKQQTLQQLETAQTRSANMYRMRGEDDRADEIEGMSLYAFAAEKGVEIIDAPARRRNPLGRLMVLNPVEEASTEADAPRDVYLAALHELKANPDDAAALRLVVALGFELGKTPDALRRILQRKGVRLVKLEAAIRRHAEREQATHEMKRLNKRLGRIEATLQGR